MWGFLLVCSVVLVGFCVVIVGNIGFVGLMVFYLVCYLVGFFYGGMIFVVVLIGVCIIELVDLIGRIVFVLIEIFCGVIMAIVGVFYFFWFLY